MKKEYIYIGDLFNEIFDTMVQIVDRTYWGFDIDFVKYDLEEIDSYNKVIEIKHFDDEYKNYGTTKIMLSLLPNEDIKVRMKAYNLTHEDIQNNLSIMNEVNNLLI